MLQAEQLPARVTDLDTGLPNVDSDNFPHFEVLIFVSLKKQAIKFGWNYVFAEMIDVEFIFISLSCFSYTRKKVEIICANINIICWKNLMLEEHTYMIKSWTTRTKLVPKMIVEDSNDAEETLFVPREANQLHNHDSSVVTMTRIHRFYFFFVSLRGHIGLCENMIFINVDAAHWPNSCLQYSNPSNVRFK
jgi:hypothetical protein